MANQLAKVTFPGGVNKAEIATWPSPLLKGVILTGMGGNSSVMGYTAGMDFLSAFLPGRPLHVPISCSKPQHLKIPAHLKKEVRFNLKSPVASWRVFTRPGKAFGEISVLL